MPIVTVTMLEGRTNQQKVEMFKEVTEALHRTLNTPRENVRIMIYEVPPQHFATAGVAKSAPSATAPKPVE